MYLLVMFVIGLTAISTAAGIAFLMGRILQFYFKSYIRDPVWICWVKSIPILIALSLLMGAFIQMAAPAIMAQADLGHTNRDKADERVY